MVEVRGSAGNAVTRTNDKPFEAFATRSGRSILDDLERAHRPLIVSPIKLADPAPPPAPEPAAKRIARESPPAPSPVSAPVVSSPAASRSAGRKPAKPARLPAPRPVKPAVAPAHDRVPAARPPAGSGQTKPDPMVTNHVRATHRKPQFDAERRRQIVDLDAAGKTRVAIAEQLGISVTTVVKHLKAAGVPPGTRRQFDWSALVDCYLKGHSVARTAAMFGCAPRTVTAALSAYHVVRRDPYYDAGQASRATQLRRPSGPNPALRTIRTDVIAAYEAGHHSVSQVARALGIAWPTAQKHMLAAGLEPANGRIGASRRPDLDPQTMRRLYLDEHQTTGEIALQLDTTPKTVRQYLQRAGVTLRNDRRRNIGVSRAYEPSTIATTLRLRKAGFNPFEIATYCRISEAAVDNILGRHWRPDPTRGKPAKTSLDLAPPGPVGEYGRAHRTNTKAPTMSDRPAPAEAVTTATDRGEHPWPYQI